MSITHRVRPLKIENPAEGGGQTDMIPVEVNPVEDYIATQGLAFHDNTSLVIDSVGRTIAYIEPYTTFSTHYLANGEVDYLEFFNSDTQITANRIYRTDFTYDTNINPLTEVTVVYDTDGTTVLRTYTYTYTYSGADLTNTTVSIV